VQPNTPHGTGKPAANRDPGRLRRRTDIALPTGGEWWIKHGGRERPATSTAWALDDSGTAGIWVCGGWIGRDESQQSTDARETGSHDPDNRAKGESSPMRH